MNKLANPDSYREESSDEESGGGFTVRIKPG